MKKQLQKITATIVVALISTTVVGQINPTAKMLPMYEDFGTTTFTAMPAGFASGMVSSAPLATQTAAQSSAASGIATIATATVAQTNGGSYGLANSGNARMYIQHSASTSTGTNQLILAINTVNWHNILVNYDIEMINANPRTAGLVFQYRVGTSGSWSNISGGVYNHSSADRANGAVDNFTNLALPTAAENQPVVQLRWASWRGTATGNSSGVAVDNVNISASPQGLNANVSVSSAPSCSQIFISEYVQASENDAIELYNPSTSAISLSGYYLTVTTGTNTATYFPLSGTIQAQKTFVLVNAKAPSAWLRGKANQLVNNLSFNGNQVVGLVYSTNPMVADVMIDAIGDPSYVPTNGYTVTALGDTGTTQNHDLTRVRTVSRGNVEWSKAQFEWYAHPMNTYGFLGKYSSVCATGALLPVVSFDASGYEVNMCPATSNTDVTFGVTLTGQGDEWENQVQPVIFDYSYLNESQYNCNSVFLPNLATYGTNNDYIFGPSGTTTTNLFPSDSTGYGVYHETFVVTVNYLQTAPVNQIYACFAFQPYSSYDIDPYAYYSNLEIRGCGYANSGIQSLFTTKQIEAYPNPFENQIVLENKSQTPVTKISVIDMLGREVLAINNIQSTTITINTQSLEDGMYYVKIYNNSNNFTVKMLKD